MKPMDQVEVKHFTNQTLTYIFSALVPKYPYEEYVTCPEVRVFPLNPNPKLRDTNNRTLWIITIVT